MQLCNLLLILTVTFTAGQEVVPSSGAVWTWALGPSLHQCFSWKPAPQAQPDFLSPPARCWKAQLLDRGQGSDTSDGRLASIPRIVSSPRVTLGSARALAPRQEGIHCDRPGPVPLWFVTCSGGWDWTPWASSALRESHVHTHTRPRDPLE